MQATQGRGNGLMILIRERLPPPLSLRRCFNGRLRLLLPGREHSAVDVVAAGVEPSAAVVAAEHSAVEPSAAIVAADALLLLSPPPPLPRDC